MASTYRQIGYGSTGSAVTKLQTILREQGYDLAVDGIFGVKTQAAVRDYQKKNALKLDGIVGPETWGSLLAVPSAPAAAPSGGTGGSSAAPGGTVSPGTAAVLKELERGYLPSDDVSAARDLLDSLSARRPEDYKSAFADQLSALLGQIENRPGFSYNPDADAAFQAYAARYASQGRTAMRHTLGQSAYLTGGYGSSYAQSAAQQAYQQHLQQLSDVLPQLQSAAYARYRDAGDALLDRYKLLEGQESAAYAQWQDQVSAWEKEVSQTKSWYQQLGDQDLKNYKLLLDYFSKKASAEQKGQQLPDSDPAAVSSIGNRSSLSSTAAESLQRAIGNYLKSGDDQKANALLSQYKSRMTPGQKKQFAALFASWNRTVSW